MNHTPEPWGVHYRGFLDDATGPAEAAVIHGPGTPGQPARSHWVADVGELHSEGDSGSMANASRIVACVNGCAGITDPSVVGQLLHCLKQIVSDLPANRDWLDPALERLARDTIAKATEVVP